MAVTREGRRRVRKGQCLYCTNARGEDDLLCDAHLELEAEEKRKALDALHWATPLVEAAGGYELDEAMMRRTAESNLGPLTDAAWDAVRLFALIAKDDGRREVAKLVRDHVNAQRVEGPYYSPEDTVKADGVIEKVKDYL